MQPAKTTPFTGLRTAAQDHEAHSGWPAVTGGPGREPLHQEGDASSTYLSEVPETQVGDQADFSKERRRPARFPQDALFQPRSLLCEPAEAEGIIPSVREQL
ncbi:hypothetical protein ABZ092_34325 [Streptomyces bobili]|uniref:hypothetical protein n=1 Tax=Streptomyces bobili TaxID=67280 RepID=UPI0033BBCBCC